MRSTVAVWKTGWLPNSETFIREQVLGLRKWEALKLAHHRVENNLDFGPDFAPYTNSLPERIERLAIGVHRRRREYLRIMQERGTRLVHAHFGSGGVIALPLARDAGLPLVVTFHGQDSHAYGGAAWQEARYRRQLRNLFDSGATLVAVSKHVRDSLVSNGAPAENVKVLYTGITPTNEQGGPRRTGVLFVGRLIQMKGASDLITAMSRLPQRLRSTQLTIVGDGPERAHLQALAAEAGLNVEFTGWLSPRGVSREMLKHAIFCAPSHQTSTAGPEGFGMVYAEAASCGMPVVAYASGGVVESTSPGLTSLLSAERDVQGLVDNLELLLSDASLRLQMGAAGKQFVRENFDLQTQCKKLEALYDDLA